MIEVSLKYLGKAGKYPPLKLTNPQLSGPLVFGEVPLWVCKPDADWLCKMNPRMFARLAEREVKVDEPVKERKPEPKVEAKEPVGICDKCQKPFFAKWTYEKHIARCTGPEE